MPAPKSSILFSGDESPREMAYKLSEMQKQFDNRISELETKNNKLEKRVAELED